MPYGEESAYAAQAALKKKSPAYMKSSGFKMKAPLRFLNFNFGGSQDNTKIKKTGNKRFSLFGGGGI